MVGQEAEVTLGNAQLFRHNPNDQFCKAKVSEKEFQKRADPHCSSEVLMVDFVTVAQRGVISAAAQSPIWSTCRSCGCRVPLRLVCT